MWWMRAREVLRMRCSISRKHRARSRLVSTSTELLNRLQRKEAVAVPEGEFQGEGTTAAPEFTAAQPGVAER